MNITVFGAGYVGLVSAVCFAKLGHSVINVDIDSTKIAALQQGTPTLYEAGLTELLSQQLATQQLTFTSDFSAALTTAQVIIIAVGTPTLPDGQADLSYVYQVVRTIGQLIQRDTLIVIKSTVPPGTGDKIDGYFQQILQERGSDCQVTVVSNPEFLQEGSAISQFFHPDRVIVGASDLQAIQTLYDLHQPLLQDKKQFVITTRRSAELTKYAANAFLATKISFINEMSQLAEKIGADIDDVKIGLGLDKRINPWFLNAGCGYGGSCFPKDILALTTLAKHHEIDTGILSAVIERNRLAQRQLFYRVRDYFKQRLQGKKIALWGLSFKPNTDDIRSASSLTIVELLLDSGARIQAYDPMAIENFRQTFPAHAALSFSADAFSALRGADALLIVTEWDEFKTVPLSTIVAELRHAAIFDGRQLWPLALVKQHPVYYYSIGRPTLQPDTNVRKHVFP